MQINDHQKIKHQDQIIQTRSAKKTTAKNFNRIHPRSWTVIDRRNQPPPSDLWGTTAARDLGCSSWAFDRWRVICPSPDRKRLNGPARTRANPRGEQGERPIENPPPPRNRADPPNQGQEKGGEPTNTEHLDQTPRTDPPRSSLSRPAGHCPAIGPSWSRELN